MYQINLVKYYFNWDIDSNEQADTVVKFTHSLSYAVISCIFSYNDIKSVIEDETLQECETKLIKQSTKLN